MKNMKTALKDRLRRHIATPGKVYRRILDLPGPQIESVRFLLAGGHLGSDSELVAVERDRRSMRTIRRKFERLGIAERSSYRDCDLCELSDEQPYDLVNADTCSSLDYRMLKFLSRLRFLPDGELNLWVCRPRGSTVASLNRLLEQEGYSDCGRELYSQVKADYGYHETKALSQYELLALMAIRSALCDYELRIERVSTYVSLHMPMFLFRFTDLRHSEGYAPSLSEFLPAENLTPVESSHHEKDGPAMSYENLASQIISAWDSGSPARKAVAKRTLNIRLAESIAQGKRDVMVKAGIKANITRRYDGDELPAMHRFVDSAIAT